MRRSLILLPLVLAACGQAKTPASANSAAVVAFKPPPVQPPAPIAGQANRTPISAYVGKYPGDAVGGVGFYDRTEVANVLIDVVTDEGVRRVITSRDAVSVPIFAAKGRIAAHGCEPHDCGEHNWTFFVKPDASGGMACYHTADMGGSSRWYAGGAPITRPGDCPSA